MAMLVAVFICFASFITNLSTAADPSAKASTLSPQSRRLLAANSAFASLHQASKPAFIRKSARQSPEISSNPEITNSFTAHSTQTSDREAEAFTPPVAIHSSFTPPVPMQRDVDTPHAFDLHTSFGLRSDEVRGQRTEIASGGWGTVYKLIRDDGQHVVIKEQFTNTDEDRAKVEYEFEIQRKVNRLDESGKHTTKALALDRPRYGTAIMIESEYGGKAIKKEAGKFNQELALSPTDPRTVCQFILQIGSLLQIINERGNILIQDVKLENILYDGRNFRLIDFGEAIDFNEPPKNVHFEVTPLITTSLQVWMLKTFGQESRSHSYEQVQGHPLLLLLRERPSLVDMQALVINILDFVIRPTADDARFYYEGTDYHMESMYRIPQLVESKQATLDEIKRKYMYAKQPEFGDALTEFLDSYWPENVSYVADANDHHQAFAKTTRKFGDWPKFMRDAQNMCQGQ